MPTTLVSYLAIVVNSKNLYLYILLIFLKLNELQFSNVNKTEKITVI